MLRIAIADDDPLARELLTHVVSMARGAEVAACVGNGHAVGAAVADADVLLLDAWMPGPGLAATVDAAKAVRPGLYVLLVTGADAATVRGLVDGIEELDGHVDKGDVHGLLAALDRVAERSGR